ncbi:MAG: ATP-binding protein [Bdellovibrionaceae bacterium]|nr:ATP-binding protein [Pseudobdellovibrionaceae bacterium]
MYTRSLTPQNKTFFLFGPRGVGKSSWVLEHYPQAKRIDLLKTSEFLKYQQDPRLFRKEIMALDKSQWIFIDEIQKLPLLLDEVQSLIEDKFIFILTGSSARKLKKSGANLLAGRALTEHLYPLTTQEMAEDFDLEQSLCFGNLPMAVNSNTTQNKIDFLQSYFETYLQEEIQQEAAVRNLGSFTRFLKIAALMNGQKLNLSALSRDAGVQRPTAQGYFQILIDTLLGDLLQPWPLKFRIKEVDHPKFYFCDTGIVRSIANQLHDPVEKVDRGFLFETLVFHELKAFNRYKKMGGEFYYWGTHNNFEIDFIYSRGRSAVGIEVKSTLTWKSEYTKSLRLLLNEKKIKHGYGIYLGADVLHDNGITIYPFAKFIQLLYEEKIPLWQ